MRSLKATLLSFTLIAALAPSALAQDPLAQDAETSALLPLPATPAPIRQVVAAVPFSVAEPFPSEYRADRHLISRGWIVVLTAEPALLIPRQTEDAILYAGAQTAERVNTGSKSGYLVAIVPQSWREDGTAVPFSQTRFWFGTPGLPERVTAQIIRAEIALADRAGLAALAPEAAARICADGAPTEQPKDRTALWNRALELVARYSPDELPEPPADTPVAK